MLKNNKSVSFLAVLQFMTIAALGFVLVQLTQLDDTLIKVNQGIISAKQEETPSLESIRATIQLALPGTPIRSVMPSPLEGLYEVTTNNGLIHTDQTGRYLFVGGIYDPKTNTDLVKARKKELGFEEDQAKQTKQAAKSKAPQPISISTEAIKDVEPYLITYREIPGAPEVIEIFDPMCGHCRTNHQELLKLNVTIKKLLVVSQGSAEINQAVYCAADPKAAIDSLLTSNSIISAIRKNLVVTLKTYCELKNGV